MVQDDLRAGSVIIIRNCGCDYLKISVLQLFGSERGEHAFLENFTNG